MKRVILPRFTGYTFSHPTISHSMPMPQLLAELSLLRREGGKHPVDLLLSHLLIPNLRSLG